MCEMKPLGSPFMRILNNGGTKQEDRNKEYNEIVGLEGQFISTNMFDVTYQSSMVW